MKVTGAFSYTQRLVFFTLFYFHLVQYLKPVIIFGSLLMNTCMLISLEYISKWWSWTYMMEDTHVCKHDCLSQSKPYESFIIFICFPIFIASPIYIPIKLTWVLRRCKLMNYTNIPPLPPGRSETLNKILLAPNNPSWDCPRCMFRLSVCIVAGCDRSSLTEGFMQHIMKSVLQCAWRQVL